MNEELNRKLAERLGFECDDWGWCWRYEEPDPATLIQKKTRGMLKRAFNFTGSFDLCLTWLVPNLPDFCNYYIGQSERSPKFFCHLHWIPQNWKVSTLEETPALALCKAIEQLIDRETSDGRP